MFGQALGGLVLVLVLFIFTEGQAWHRPTLEFIFFTGWLHSLSAVALLVPDSPLQYLITINKHPVSLAIIFGVVVPLYCAFFVASISEAGLVSFQQHRQGGSNTFESRLMQHQASQSKPANQHEVRKIRRSQRGDSTMFDAQVVNEKEFVVRSKQQYISRTLDRLTFTSQIRYVAAWLRGKIDERQQTIRKVLQDSTPEELNHIMQSINVPKLFRYGTNSRQMNNVLQYIMEERHDDLTTIARASVLHGLMRTQTLQFFPQEMEWSKTVFCGAKGVELTLLKNMLDSSGDFNNLYKLVYNDIAKPELRKSILKHIAKEGEKVRAEYDAKNHLALKILSDVDDTLYCSGGSFPAGSDERFPRHALYPGVLTLFEELDMSSRASGDSEEPESEDSRRNLHVNVSVHVPWKQGGGVYEFEATQKDTIAKLNDTVQETFNIPPEKQKLVLTQKKVKSMEDNVELWKDGNVVFVSARPHVFKDVAENGSYRRFLKLVNDGKMHATPTLLSGSLTSGTLAIAIRFWEKVQILAMDVYDMTLAALASISEKAKKKRARHSKKKRGSLLPEQEPGVPDDDDEGEGVNGTELVRSISSGGMNRNTTNRNWEAVGRQKVGSMEKYSKLYPEYDLVFFGDNGQGDLLAAELMATTSKVKHRMKMCFIHQVQSNEDDSLLSIFERDEREDQWSANGIVFFETYVEAASIAYEAGLISSRGLHRVGLSVHDELMDYFVKYPHRVEQWEQVMSQTKRDIRRANKLLRSSPDSSKLQIPVPILPESFLK